MLEIRNRKTLQSKIMVCKSDVKIGDCAHSLSKYKQKHDHLLSIINVPDDIISYYDLKCNTHTV